jgi:hypothetical protein
MNYHNKQLKTTIPVPQKLFESMVEVYQKWEKFSDEFEDFILAHDEKFIKKMRKAKKEHQAGKLKNIEVLKQEL